MSRLAEIRAEIVRLALLLSAPLLSLSAPSSLSFPFFCDAINGGKRSCRQLWSYLRTVWREEQVAVASHKRPLLSLSILHRLIIGAALASSPFRRSF